MAKTTVNAMVTRIKRRIDYDITDTDTGRIYNRRPQFKTNPSQAIIDAQVVVEKTRIQFDLDCDANALNLPTDEDRLLEYYRGIKRDVVLRIRAYPAATAQQASDYIATEYPNSPFDFNRLYGIWSNIVGTSSWADFKTWVIDHKFREYDT